METLSLSYFNILGMIVKRQHIEMETAWVMHRLRSARQ